MRSKRALAGLSAVAATALTAVAFAVGAADLPDPEVDETPGPGTETAVLGGGCFWGVEAVFEHVRGVSDVVSGYAGGSGDTATYEQVSTGRTGHAESVSITYDPAQVTYGQLLKVFFEVAHDPTELNRQGPDIGTQYRSVIFYASDEQKRIAESYVQQLNTAGLYSHPIVTQVTPLEGFYAAEAYHQNYLPRHPNQPYIVIHDEPKLAELKRRLPGLYTDQ